MSTPQWTDAKKNPPKEYTIALVINSNGYMAPVEARYEPEYDMWVYYSDCIPGVHKFLTLDVTHYFVLPPIPTR